MALVHCRAASENAFFVLLAKAKARLKNPRTWKRRKERKREEGGRGQECGGEGAEIKFVSALKGEKVQSALHFFSPLISENILFFPHVVFFLAFLIPPIQAHVRKWQIRGAVAPRKGPTWCDPKAARAARDPRPGAASTPPILYPATPPESSARSHYIVLKFP